MSQGLQQSINFPHNPHVPWLCVCICGLRVCICGLMLEEGTGCPALSFSDSFPEKGSLFELGAHPF